MERLTGVAIKREGCIHERGAGCREHWRLRQIINPRLLPDDIDGFMTNYGCFVTRAEARTLAIASGQLSSSWKTSARNLFSSDIDWEAGQ